MNKTLILLLTLASTAGATSASFEELQAMGREAYNHGDYRAAALHWNQARQLAAGGPAEKLAAVTANLAALQSSLGNVGASLAGYQEALRHWEAAGLDRPDMRHTLRQMADVLRQVGEHDKARQMLKRLSTLLESDATPDQESLVRLRLSLARLEQATGQSAAAATLYRQVLAEAPADLSLQAAAWDGLGEASGKQGNLPAAERAFQEALKLWEAIGHPVRVAGTLNRIGDRWLCQRKPRQALPYLERALAIFEEKGVRGAQLAATLSNLGQAYRFRGDLTLADRYYERAQTVAERDLGVGHPILAAILLNRGDFARARKRYREAETYLLQAMAIDEQRLSRQHPDVARDLALLAQVHLRQGRRDVACQELGEALAIRERSQIPLDIEQASWLELRASLLRSGEHYAEAAKSEAKAMRIRVQQMLR